ncbi:MAG: DUF721 domain-containing protein [Candidatus Omnitrophica bacterium]|nr:DUF721 domain-containing protein [Candidatus Omnitrophota bacterium]
MKKVRPELIKVILNKVVSDLDSKISSKNNQVLDVWSAEVDERIKKHTNPVSFINKILIVEVDSSGWLFEIERRHKKDILKKLRSIIGEEEIENIRFRMGEIKHASGKKEDR